MDNLPKKRFLNERQKQMIRGMTGEPSDLTVPDPALRHSPDVVNPMSLDERQAIIQNLAKIRAAQQQRDALMKSQMDQEDAQNQAFQQQFQNEPELNPDEYKPYPRLNKRLRRED